MGEGRRWQIVGALAVAVALLLLVGRPLAALGAAALVDGGPALSGLADGHLVRAVANTLWTSGVVTVLAVTAATAAALVIERTAVPGRAWLRLGMLVPLLTPPHVAALSWARAYGPAGLSEELVGIEVPGVYGPVGVVTVITVNAIPLAYVIVAAALATRAEPDLERAARSSGATRWTAVRTITAPLLRPALLAAAALVFVTSVNAFGVPAILGRPAGFTTVTTRIHQDLVRSADMLAFSRVLVAASGLVVLAIIVVGMTDAVVGSRLSRARTGAPAGATDAGPRRWWPAAVVWGYLVVLVGVPLVALTLVAVTRAVGLPPTPENWTTANFSEVLSGPAAAALGNSMRLALSAAVGVVLLGGLLVAVGRWRGGRVLGTTAALTFAVPGSALAVAILLAWGGRLRDTLTLILLAYLAKFWALGHRCIAGAVEGLPPDLARAARSSGATAARATWTVTLPLLRPAIAGGGLLAFLFALHELTMSALLVGPGTRTLAVVILDYNQLGDVLASAALAVLLTGVTAFLAAAALVLRRRLGVA